MRQYIFFFISFLLLASNIFAAEQSDENILQASFSLFKKKSSAKKQQPEKLVANFVKYQQDLLKAMLRNAVEHPVDSIIYICGQPILTSETTITFYRKNQYRPAWVDEDGFNQNGTTLVSAIFNAGENGLKTEDYHYAKLKRLNDAFSKNPLKRKTAEAEDLLLGEMLLTDAFFLFASHLYYGKTDPETIDPQWHAERNNCPIEMDNYLLDALKAKNLREALQLLEPQQEEYAVMKEKLQSLRKILKQGGWQKIDFGSLKKIELKDNNEVIPLIRQRLQISGEYKDTSNFTSLVYDSVLFAAVKLFQKHNGLDADGVIGKGTMDALNVSVKDRMETLLLNMERMRWLPRDTDNNRYIIVNIAAFNMKVIDKGKVIINSKAIVGRTYRMTPVFTAKMTYLIANPFWTVPKTILREDVIPDVKKDLNYLKKKNMRIIDYKGNEIDPHSIDWSKITPRNFPYMIRQDPGKSNSLGSIKFMFPNKYDVYMHDTPDKKLFDKEDRAYSSGCIRIQEYLKLAAYLLRTKEVTEDSIQRLLDSGKQMQINLPEPIMVHVVYLTANVSNGEVIFRKDFYDRDKTLKAALFRDYE
jgi:L,D-transpeptidase YcbB